MQANILRISKNDADLLSRLAIQSFIESHGHSASPEEIRNYYTQYYNEQALAEELTEAKNIFHIIYYDGKPAGFSKLILNCALTEISLENVAKLERIYLLQEFHDLKLGWKLFEFNRKLAESNGQNGMWLYVWKENSQALNFYKKAGFKIIGNYDFRISPTHINPNHVMILQF